MEIPVVVSGIEGLREVVLDEKTGFFTPPSDPAAVARAVERFITEPSLRHSMGKAGRHFVKDNFEWSNCAESMKGIYAGCLEMAGGAR